MLTFCMDKADEYYSKRFYRWSFDIISKGCLFFKATMNIITERYNFLYPAPCENLPFKRADTHPCVLIGLDRLDILTGFGKVSIPGENQNCCG